MYVSWSPDGNRLAVSWSRPTEDRALGVYLIDLDTWSTSGPIVSRPGKFGSIRWSPDGEWLLFSMGRQLHKVKTNGDSLTQLTSGDNHYFGDWAPSDTMIAAERHPGDSSGIWLIDVDGSDPRYLVWAGGHPCFDPYDSLLFVSWKRVSDPDTAHIALLCPADSGVRTVYSISPGPPYPTYRYLCVSPVDRRIVLQIDLNIFTLTIDGTELTQLTVDGGHCPTWSPDGSRIAYVKPTLEGGSLWIMNSDGSNKTPVPGWE
jgi:Tol biopolymer transport system component